MVAKLGCSTPPVCQPLKASGRFFFWANFSTIPKTTPYATALVIILPAYIHDLVQQQWAHRPLLVLRRDWPVRLLWRWWVHKILDTFPLLFSVQCSFMEYKNYKVVYRRYASLYFIIGIDTTEVCIPYSGKLLHGANFCGFRGWANYREKKPTKIFNSPVGTALCRVLSQK